MTDLLWFIFMLPIAVCGGLLLVFAAYLFLAGIMMSVVAAVVAVVEAVQRRNVRRDDARR